MEARRFRLASSFALKLHLRQPSSRPIRRGCESLHQFVGQAGDNLRRGRLRPVVPHGLAEDDGFLEVLGQGDHRGEDVLAVDLAEVRLVGDMDPQRFVEHRDQVADQLQPGVCLGPDPGERPADGDQSLGAVIFGLERDDDPVGRDQGAHEASCTLGGQSISARS